MDQRTLLIIDDSAADRAGIVEAMARDADFDCRMVEARTFAEGRARLRECQPDCIMLPSQPEGEALDFMRAAREVLGGAPPAAFIVLHRGADASSAAPLRKAGAHGVLMRSEAESGALRMAIHNAISNVRTERRLEEQCAELERLHAECTAANTAKDRFLAMLSHELRTPLTPVLAMVSSAASDTTLSPDLRESFAMILRNVELEARLIDDLLDVTKIRSGELRIERQPVDVHRCIQAALDLCEAAFDERRINVRTDLAARESVVIGDFGRLHQVMWNLLKNAAKFSHASGEVQVATADSSDGVMIEIRDGGVGIEPSRLSSIFCAFHPLAVPPSAPGVGLGLAIARAIVESHGGTIRAASGGEGRGAVFHICLPVADGVGRERDMPPASSAGAACCRSVLIVEDHEDTRRALARALRRRGLAVTAAGSAAAAREQYLRSPTDIVICDVGLPDGTGWELLEKLRAYAPVRAIAVSGYGMSDDVERSRAAGFVAHVTKPVDFDKLDRLIAEQLVEGAGQ